MSSTSRITKTVRNATGNSSIRRSRCAAPPRATPHSSAIRTSRRRGRATAGRRAVRSPREWHDHTVALLPPQPSERLVDHDSRQPRGQLRAAAEAVDIPISVQIGILQGILSLGIVSENRTRDLGRAGRCACASGFRRPRRPPGPVRDEDGEIGVVYGSFCGHQDPCPGLDAFAAAGVPGRRRPRFSRLATRPSGRSVTACHQGDVTGQKRNQGEDDHHLHVGRRDQVGRQS